jgi:hypothetical protein
MMGSFVSVIRVIAADIDPFRYIGPTFEDYLPIQGMTPPNDCLPV